MFLDRLQSKSPNRRVSYPDVEGIVCSRPRSFSHRTSQAPLANEGETYAASEYERADTMSNPGTPTPAATQALDDERAAFEADLAKLREEVWNALPALLGELTSPQEQKREAQLKAFEQERAADSSAFSPSTSVTAPTATAADAQRRDEELKLANKALQDVRQADVRHFLTSRSRRHPRWPLTRSAWSRSRRSAPSARSAAPRRSAAARLWFAALPFTLRGANDCSLL